jgi:hypothetical protein
MTTLFVWSPSSAFFFYGLTCFIVASFDLNMVYPTRRMLILFVVHPLILFTVRLFGPMVLSPRSFHC